MLAFGPLPADTVHLCIDMQRVFAEDTPWHTPWMGRVLPVVRRIAAARPERTIFTRFMPPTHSEGAHGTWRRYYRRWAELTLARAGEGIFELVPDLAALHPPAAVVDKPTYAPWGVAAFEQALAERAPGALVITGAETDLCVLAAVLGAVDRGYRVVLPTDALCSSSDVTHDALLTLYRRRFAEQIETCRAADVLAAWA